MKNGLFALSKAAIFHNDPFFIFFLMKLIITNLTVSADPIRPVEVESRTATRVRFPTREKTTALEYLVIL